MEQEKSGEKTYIFEVIHRSTARFDGKRLGCSDKAIQKHREKEDKEKFAAWSRDRDPDGIAWTWEGGGGRGKPLRFIPVD
jgi:hypothetical protein